MLLFLCENFFRQHFLTTCLYGFIYIAVRRPCISAFGYGVSSSWSSISGKAILGTWKFLFWLWKGWHNLLFEMTTAFGFSAMHAHVLFSAIVMGQWHPIHWDVPDIFCDWMWSVSVHKLDSIKSVRNKVLVKDANSFLQIEHWALFGWAYTQLSLNI